MRLVCAACLSPKPMRPACSACLSPGPSGEWIPHTQAKFFEDRFFPAAANPVPTVVAPAVLSYPSVPRRVPPPDLPPDNDDTLNPAGVAPAVAAPPAAGLVDIVAPPVPPSLVFSNPGPANAPPVGDRSTRARRPPDYLGFARAAHDLEFAAHASVSIEDFDEDDPDVQLYSYEEATAFLAKVDRDNTPSVRAALAATAEATGGVMLSRLLKRW
ncbi:BQ5605_C003g02008 [Microbotryum silenes-dioicae]|uniref:BQ5605_C003g02008 protein n=1 Tax=Microbotryum silenes-dioicae TaxID=796604 RepID=A0A2X0M0E0_9BASI|nr:BQ5605_C003g02008 [Microbotryum silenes-dioicae]